MMFNWCLFKEKLSPLQETEKARNERWAFLIPGYAQANRNKKKKMKQEYRKMSSCTAAPISMFSLAFDTCAPTQEAIGCKPSQLKAPRKGNENMYVEQNMTVTEKTAEDSRRQHFLDEISRIYSKKDCELREKFGLNRPSSPRNPKELVDMIKAGDWTYAKGYNPDAEDEDDEGGWCRYEPVLHGFRWTKIKEDVKGYSRARDLLIEEKTHFVNEIWAEVDPANFIKILEKFEKSKLH